MQGLQVELIFRFDGYETHVLPLHGFGNRFRVAVVVLVGLHVRSGIVRGSADTAAYESAASNSSLSPVLLTLAGKMVTFTYDAELQGKFPHRPLDIRHSR